MKEGNNSIHQVVMPSNTFRHLIGDNMCPCQDLSVVTSVEGREGGEKLDEVEVSGLFLQLQVGLYGRSALFLLRMENPERLLCRQPQRRQQTITKSFSLLLCIFHLPQNPEVFLLTTLG